MKKIASLLAILLTVGTTAFATGTDKGKPVKETSEVTASTVNVSILPYTNNQGLTVIAANEAENKVIVTIYDAFGETVSKEEFTTPLVKRSYNLAALPNGVYTVNVSSDNYTVSRTLDLQ